MQEFEIPHKILQKYEELLDRGKQLKCTSNEWNQLMDNCV